MYIKLYYDVLKKCKTKIPEIFDKTLRNTKFVALFDLAYFTIFLRIGKPSVSPSNTHLFSYYTQKESVSEKS